MTIDSLIPVILCGGTGTRLWPLSRASYPKQYLALNSNSQKSLLQETQERLCGLEKLKDPILICHEDHRFIVAEQMRQINIDPTAILLEPIGRNTAPAITIAALKATEGGADPMLLILAADHKIPEKAKLQRVIEAGRIEANKGRLVTFGIIPTSPETGYGYIEAISPLSNETLQGSPIARFIEKPNLNTAKQFINDERFTWNSGIFLFKASAIINEMEKLAPEIVRCCRHALEEEMNDLDFQRVEREAFLRCPNVSIDVAVMEKTNLGTVLPLNAGWSDIGNWKTLWDSSEKDDDGNVIEGNVISKDNKNCYLRSENRLIVGLGIENLVVVETNDAILISHKNHAQNVKKIVKQLEEEGRTEAKAHSKIYRPWGHYTTVVEGKRWQVKRIEVKPGATLSLQMHHHRAEHWIVVKGTAIVEINNEQNLLGENQSTYIPLGSKHRLSNPGRMPLVLIEVQSGAYLGEDDIVRFEDQYGRIDKVKSK